jgi:sulfur carrier protein ThiS adenylyltransferase
MPLQLTIQGQPVTLQAPASIGELRDRFKPGADVLISDGAVVSADHVPGDGSQVTLIRRGEVPSAQELEACMVSRHTPGVHAALRKAVVGIAGLGGLGSAVAVALARVGVGTLVLVDHDVVEPSNLNRQQYFVDQIGLPKTQALAANLQRINPHVRHQVHQQRVTADNAPSLFGGVHVMVEAFDLADQKLMLLEAFTTACPDVPYVGASGLAGHGDEQHIRVHRMGERVFIVGDLHSAAQPGRGLMAPRVGVAAHMQANLVVRLLLGEISAR